MTKLPAVSTMHKAFEKSDPEFDGIFVVGVKTTGVFCRPVCKARKAKRENTEFFATPQAAIRNGYRPCKLCRPLDASGSVPPLVARLLELIEARGGDPLTELDLRDMSIEPSTARRQFREHCGMTFAGYQRARRLGGALRGMQEGDDIPLAMSEAGFESESGFRTAFRAMFGPPPSRAEGLDVLSADWMRTPLGTMLAVTDGDGLIMLEFVNPDHLTETEATLRRRLASARRLRPVVHQKHPTLELLRKELKAYFAGQLQSFSVPLNPHGSEFERKVWGFLRTIPFGQTRSYGQQAAAIGSAKASRAVGRANGCNMLGIVIPCHRVIGADGSLTGFGGGLARKQWLLEHEKSVLAESL